MDRKQLCRLIDEALSDIAERKIEISFEDGDKIRVEIVSDIFKGMNLTSRITLLTKKFLALIMNELQDYHLIYNPLTVNEMKLKISETVERSFNDEPSGLKRIASQNSVTSSN